MKQLITCSLLFFNSFFSFSQLPCLPDAGGILASDEPPGCFLCSQTYEGSTDGFTPDSVDYDFLCGEIENSQWLTVRANKFGRVDLDFILKSSENSKGFQVGLYDKDFIQRGPCISSSAIGRTISFSTDVLIPHEEYWLMIDGEQGDICEFSVEHSQMPTFVNNTITSSDGNRTEACFGAQICYKTNGDASINSYNWTIPSGISILSGGGVRDSSICLEFNKIGLQKIELELELECDNYIYDAHSINIENGLVFREQISLTLCSGELPFEIKGQVIDSFGITEFVLETRSRCDSLFTVFAAEMTIVDSQKYLICQGDSVVIDNTPIIETGIKEFFYPEGSVDLCDSTAVINVEVVDTTPPKINCIVDTFINSLGIIWNDNPHVDFYKMKLNDSLVFLTARRSYLYQSDISEEVVNISVKPYSDYCIHQEGKMTCKTAKITTAIENLEQSAIQVFPNPSSSIFKILSQKPVEKIEVFDLSGRQILSKNTLEIDLKNHPSGIYFFKIQTDSGMVLKKVFKED